jgi:hypothetical protein
LGNTSLPAYIRSDISVRKHWHVQFAGRDLELAAYGTLSNLFGRSNTLTIAQSETGGEPVRVNMRPLAPLVLGLEWRY